MYKTLFITELFWFIFAFLIVIKILLIGNQLIGFVEVYFFENKSIKSTKV